MKPVRIVNNQNGDEGSRLVTGHILEGEGIPNLGIYILGRTGNNIIASAVTDVNGNFEILDIASGSYRIALDIPGVPLEETTMDLNLEQGVSLTEVTALVDLDSENPVSFTIEIILGKELEQGFSLYPNPSRKFIRISSEQSAIESIKSIEVLSASGTVVPVKFEKSQGQLLIDVEGLADGSYSLRIITEEGSEVRRFIKLN